MNLIKICFVFKRFLPPKLIFFTTKIISTKITWDFYRGKQLHSRFFLAEKTRVMYSENNWIFFWRKELQGISKKNSIFFPAEKTLVMISENNTRFFFGTFELYKSGIFSGKNLPSYTTLECVGGKKVRFIWLEKFLGKNYFELYPCRKIFLWRQKLFHMTSLLVITWYVTS